MSLDQINDYSIGNVNLTSMMMSMDLQRRDKQAISLTHYDDNLEPKIAAGSIVELGGALFKCKADESITGWAGISNDEDVYVKLVPSGTTATAAFTTAVPTWSTSKQGWYVGNDRYVGGLYKDVGGNYTQKHLFRDLWQKFTLLNTGVKIGNNTRSTAGDQIISGVGFQPSIIFFMATDDVLANRNDSWGVDDGINPWALYIYNNGAASVVATTKSISIARDGANKINGVVSALGADGFTITWTLTGACVCNFFYVCLP